MVLTQVLDVTIEELAGETGDKSQTIRKRQRKPESLLAKAAA